MRQVIVTEVFPVMGASVWEAEGYDADNGIKIRFAGDWRSMQDIFNEVHYGDDHEPIVNIEDWQIVRLG